LRQDVELPLGFRPPPRRESYLAGPTPSSSRKRRGLNRSPARPTPRSLSSRFVHRLQIRPSVGADNLLATRRRHGCSADGERAQTRRRVVTVLLCALSGGVLWSRRPDRCARGRADRGRDRCRGREKAGSVSMLRHRSLARGNCGGGGSFRHVIRGARRGRAPDGCCGARPSRGTGWRCPGWHAVGARPVRAGTRLFPPGRSQLRLWRWLLRRPHRGARSRRGSSLRRFWAFWPSHLR
jgi:hypothetical protein